MAVESSYPMGSLHNDDSDENLIRHRGHGEEHSYARDFHPSKQTWKLFWGQAFRLSLTIMLVSLVIATLKFYEHRGNMAHHNKYYFNTITTILSLALSLNFLEAFKDMAKVLRWRVLANRRFTVREADLILGGESLMKLIRLMWESKRKPLTMVVCIVWIALNLLAQAAVATISLTYSLDSGTNSSGIITSPGTVNATLVDCYYSAGECTNPPKVAPETSQTLAHAYGEIVRGLTYCNYSTDEDIKKSPQDCMYFGSNDYSEFAFRFAEYNLEDTAGSYPYMTNRMIKAYSGHCYQYSVNKDIDQIDSTDGIKGTNVYTFYNDTHKGILPIPRPNAAFDATSYVWNGTLAPQNETEQVCGPRCVWLFAMQSVGVQTKRPHLVFQCPITISEVSNAMLPEHRVSDDIARLAAASIALTGRYTTPNQSEPVVWNQYQLYPWESYWETNALTPQEVGSRMAEFAIGSLASMAFLNPPTSIPGTVPTLAYHIDVEWRWVITLSAGITAVHAALVALILWISRPIVVAGDSNLVVARLLNGLVGRLGERGALLDGKEIARAVEREGVVGEDIGDGESERRVGYGVREKGGEGREGMVLELSGQVEVSLGREPGKFLRGRYL